MAQPKRAKSQSNGKVDAKARTKTGLEQEYYQSLFSEALDGIFVCDQRGKYVDVNRRGCKMLGYTRREILRMSLSDVIFPEDLKTNPIRMDDLQAGKTVVTERRLRCKDGRLLPVEIRARSLSNGNLVGVVRDIGERKQAEGALRESEERFRSFYENSTIGIYRTTPDGQILSANPALVAMLGYDSAEELLQRNLEQGGYEPGYERGIFREQIERAGSIRGLESAWKRKDGSVIYVRESAKALRDENGKTLYYEGVVEDCTEQKQAEILYLALFNQSHDAIFILDLQGRHMQSNQRAAELLGYTQEELGQLFIWETSTQPEASKIVLQRLIEGERMPLYERVFRKKNGDLLYAEINAELIRDLDGKPLHIQSVMRDITERKKIEEKLQLQSAALEVAANTIVITDRDGLIEWTNPSFELLTGYDASDAVGQSPRDLIRSGVQGEEFYENLWNTILSGQVWHGELVNRRKDGEKYKEEMTITPLRDEAGEITHFIAIKQNITERKQAEEALRMAEAKYRSIFEGAVEGIYQSTPDGHFITVNPALARIWGYASSEDLIASVQNISQQIYVQAHRRNDFIKMLNEQGEAHGFEYEAYRKDGQTVWVSENARAVKDEKGAILYYEGNIEDITNRKKVEMALDESEERYRLLFSHSPFGILLADVDGQVLDVNATALQIIGSPSAEATKEINLLTFPSLIQAGISADFQRCIELDQPLTAERWYTTKWGKSIDAMLRYIPLAGKDGSIAQVQIIFEDITENKKSEQALRESEKLLREAQALAGLGSYTLDIPTGQWKSSELLDEIFGIGADFERTIAGWQEVIHPDDRAMMSEYFASEVIGQRKNFDKEYRILRIADQSLRWVHGLGKLEFNADGQPVKMHGTIQDINSRKLHEHELEAEAMLAQSLSETYELQPLLEQLLEAVCHAIPAGEKSSLALMIDDHQLQVMAFRGYQPHVSGFTYSSSWGFGGRAIRQRRPILIDDIALDNALRDDASSLKEDEIREIRSAIAVPLLIHDTAIGVLSLESLKPGAFTDGDLRLLVNFGSSAALIIERARLFDETRRHVTETATLLQTSLALTDLDMQSTLQTIGTHASALFETDACRIFLTDEADAGALRCVLALGENQSAMLGLKIWLGEGVTGDVAAKGQAEIVNNMGGDPRAVQVPGTPEEEESIMFAPLKSGEKVIGVMSVKRLGLIHPFTASDLELLKAFASMSASAVSNARLFEETRQRLVELTTIHQTAQRLTRLHTPDLLAQEIVKILEETLHYEYGAVMLISTDGRSLEPFALSDQAHGVNFREQDRSFTEGLSIQVGRGITGWVAEHGQSVRLGDAPHDERYLAARENIQSELCVPLRFGERVIGIVNVESRRPNAYSESDQRVLETIAAQIAISINNAELFDGTRQQVTELEMLYESGMELSQTLSPKEIGEKVIQLLEQKMGWHHATVRLYRPQDDSFELLAFNQPGLTTDEERREVARKFNSLVPGPASGMSGWAFRNLQILRCGNVRNDPRYVETHPNLNSGLYVPIRSGQAAIGILSIESELSNAFSETDERLAATLANQAASALENARLFDEVRQRVSKLETINRVSIALRAISNQKAILAIVLEEILKALNLTVGSIRIWDHEARQLRQEAARGWTTDLEGELVKPGEGIVGKVFESGQMYISRDFYNDPLTLPRTRHKMPRNWGGICAPISSSDESLGVLLIGAPSSREFNKEEARLLTTLAEMTGAALHRMNLLNETLRRAREFESLYETSRVISAEGDLTALLQTIVNSATGMLGASAGGLYLYDAVKQELEVVVATDIAIPVGIRLNLGEGAAGRVAQTRQPIRIENYFEWEGRSLKYSTSPIHAVLEVPITYGGELIGVLAVEEVGSSKRKYTNADERLLTLFASQAAGAIKSARLHEETLHRLKQLQALRVIDRAIAGSLDKRVTLNILVDQIISQLDADAADVLLLNPYLQTLQFAAGHGFRTHLSEATELHMGLSFAGRAVIERRIQRVSDAATAGRNPEFLQFWNHEGFSSYHAVPLIAKGQVIGVIEVFHRSSFQPDVEWINFLETLADQTAIALDNAQMFENVQNVNMELSLAYEATIEGWSRAMDLRDEETEGHTQRVAEMAVNLARVMGFDGEELLHVRRGALLHDIGKIGVPDHILHKKDGLTEEEWKIMRQHPKFAHEMLLPISYLRQSLDIPYKHHERWDGSGYPQGLVGEQIPLAARIFAIVDVYDALVSDRPYRKAWTHEQTIQYIREQSGIQFDPFVVEKFIEVFGKKRL